MAIKSTPSNNNIDLTSIERTKFTINNDPARVVYLNLSDMGIATRLDEFQPKFVDILENVTKALSDDEDLKAVAVAIKEGDLKVRQLIDELFDAEVSSACAPEGTMFDLFNGSFRFEIIIENIANLYVANVDSEVKSLKKKTSKYTKKYHK